MLIVWILFLFAPTNWVLAAEPPHLNVGDTSTSVPPTGGGDFDTIAMQLLLQLTQDMKQVKGDVSDVKVNQAVLQQDVSDLKGDVNVIKGEMSQVQLNQALLQQDVSSTQQDVSSLQQSSAVSSVKISRLESSVEGNLVWIFVGIASIILIPLY